MTQTLHISHKHTTWVTKSWHKNFTSKKANAVFERLLDGDHRICSEVCMAVLQYSVYESTGLVHTAASCLSAITI